MTATRRRTRPLRKPSTSQQRRRRPRKPKIDWSDNLIKFLIGLVLVVDLVLIYFVARQCSKPAVVVEEPTTPVEETRILQIEVLNGCGVSGIANEYTDYLRGKGFDVVKTDNYESFNVLRTVVIDRRGNIKNGVRIAEALGLGEDRVLQEVNEAYLIDATVILGKDYRQLEAWQLMED